MASEVFNWLQNFAVQVAGQFYDPESPTGLADGFIVEALFVTIAYLLGRAAQVGSDKERSRAAVASDLLRDFREVHNFRDYAMAERPAVRLRGLSRLDETINNIGNRIDLKSGIAPALDQFRDYVQRYRDNYSNSRAIWEGESEAWEKMAVSLDALLKKLLKRKVYQSRLKELEPLRKLREYPPAPEEPKQPYAGLIAGLWNKSPSAPAAPAGPQTAPSMMPLPAAAQSHEEHPIGQ